MAIEIVLKRGVVGKRHRIEVAGPRLDQAEQGCWRKAVALDRRPQAIGDRMSGGRGRRQADGIAPPLPAHVSHRRFTRHGMSDPGELRSKGRHGH